MGKKIRRLILTTLDIIDYLKGVISRIIKTLVQSTVICFPLVITFMLINSFLGTYIRFGFYLKLAIILTLVVALILCGLRYKAIFIKHAKVSKKTVPAKTNKKPQKTIHRKRIS